MKRHTILVVPLAILLILATATPVLASDAATGLIPRTAALMRATAVVLPNGLLGVPKNSAESCRLVISVLNNNPKSYIVEDGVVSFNVPLLLESSLVGKAYDREDLEFVVKVLEMLKNARFKNLQDGGLTICAQWYEYPHLWTNKWTRTTRQEVPEARLWYPDSGAWGHTVTETFSVTVSGALILPLSLLQLYASVDVSWSDSQTITLMVNLNPPAPPPPPPTQWSLSYACILRNYTDTETYYAWYWCTDEEIPGEVTCYYMGTYIDYTSRYNWRSLTEVQEFTEQDPGF